MSCDPTSGLLSCSCECHRDNDWFVRADVMYDHVRQVMCRCDVLHWPQTCALGFSLLSHPTSPSSLSPLSDVTLLPLYSYCQPFRSTPIGTRSSQSSLLFVFCGR